MWNSGTLVLFLLVRSLFLLMLILILLMLLLHHQKTFHKSPLIYKIGYNLDIPFSFLNIFASLVNILPFLSFFLSFLHSRMAGKAINFIARPRTKPAPKVHQLSLNFA